MTAATLRVHFLQDVIARARLRLEGALHTWAEEEHGQFGMGGFGVRPRAQHRTHLLRVSEEVVQRGIWRVQGGQTKELVLGFDADMKAEVIKADTEQDAELMTPATCSALIQVGLFGKVMYP